MTEAQAKRLTKTFLSDAMINELITYDCDGYDQNGTLLFKYRKNALPVEVVKQGYESFKDSIQLNDGRGVASGHFEFRQYKAKGNEARGLRVGDTSRMQMGAMVESGLVGFKDADGMNPYCRMTSFTKQHFETYTAGLPFVQSVDSLYKDLCPDHYAQQRAIADATNRNYVIPGTAFTTVTVNKNFQTAVHTDSGDFMRGMGNLCVYRESSFDGCYFVLPEYGVGFDLHNGDMLFVDVHRYHGNTPFKNCEPNYLRVSFVMYYREQMINCKQPSEELKNVQHTQGNFFKI